MTVKWCDGWLLEASSEAVRGKYSAWVSDPRRMVTGYGQGVTEREAVRAALIDATEHRVFNARAIIGLQAAYLGHDGSFDPRRGWDYV